MLTYFLTELQEVSTVLILILSTKKAQRGRNVPKTTQAGISPGEPAGHSMDSLTMD